MFCIVGKKKDFFCFFQNGEIQPVSVKVGEKVLLPEYGGTKIVLEDKVSFPSFLPAEEAGPKTSILLPLTNSVVLAALRKCSC